MAALRLIGALLFLCSGALSALADKFVEIDGREEFAENIKESQQVWAVVWACSRCKRVGDPAFPNLKERCDAFASTWPRCPRMSTLASIGRLWMWTISSCKPSPSRRCACASRCAWRCRAAGRAAVATSRARAAASRARTAA